MRAGNDSGDMTAATGWSKEATHASVGQYQDEHPRSVKAFAMLSSGKKRVSKIKLLTEPELWTR